MSVTRFYCPHEYAAGNSLVNWLGRPLDDILKYAETYRSSACRLVHAHRELKLTTPDEQVLPILFLYRHSLELSLKAIIYHAAEVTIPQNELTLALPRLWREHSLVKLQKMALPVFRANKCIDLDLEELEACLATTARAIDEFDGGSYAFRYPVTTTGLSSLPSTFMVNMFFYSDEMESLLTKCFTFCRSLKEDGQYSSTQMKLALHSLNEIS